VCDDGGRDWLQYWFWLYYNPKNLFGFGKHEGDWEMIQLGLDADGQAGVLAYAQHDSGEARKADEAEWIERDGERHPVVYVSPLSHASYFESGTHPYPIGIDHPYGDGPEAWLAVESFGDWVQWPGRWGNSERALLRQQVGNGPPSPSHQASKWSSPAAFQRKLGRRRFRAFLGRLLHRLGERFYPNPPELSTRLDGRRCTVEYRMRNTRGRRSRHLYLTVHDGERVIASRAVRDAGDSGAEILRLAHVPASLEVWGSTFNRVRQRSDLMKATEEG
jgi:Vacuolar protein sorting-associated protein 62